MSREQKRFPMEADMLVNLKMVSFMVKARVRQAEIVTVTGLKGKAPREIQLEEMEPELEKMYNDMVEMAI